ncbi:M48 family metalloprotease [Selenomonas sp. ND2010]|uniref:M48 family metalloprotease n=1 Tax=Selenomonas sp. ND2010 TaxID=1410618 RepID=UPI00051B1F6E|nr:M48 family metalloprotease [Selenomonas sp. ND2010]
MDWKKASKKTIMAVVLATSFTGVSMVAQQPATAEAFSLGNLGDLQGIAQMGQQFAEAKAKLSSEVDMLNKTEEGSTYWMNYFQQQYGVDNDPAMNRRLTNMMQVMTAAIRQVDSSIDDKPYRYFLNPDKSFNAFCGMGHVMSVNRGAFERVSCDDELAFVVGHEMGHGQKDHTAKSILKSADKKLLAQIASQSLGGTQLTDTICQMGMNISKAHSDKGREWEADNLSWEYMTHTNYNLGAGAAVWQRMLEEYGDNAQRGLNLWFNPSDHPNHAARRDNYVKKLEAYSGKHVTAKNGDVFVNGKKFVTPMAQENISSEERSYLVMGNLARAYHDGQNKNAVTVKGNTVMMGSQAILTTNADDESAQTLADRLNSIK